MASSSEGKLFRCSHLKMILPYRKNEAGSSCQACITLSTGHHKCLPSLTPRAQEDKLGAGGERRCEDPNPLIPLPLRLKKSSNLNISFGLTQPRKRWPCVPVSLSEPISTQKRATNRLLTLLARLTAPCAPGALAGSRRIR